MTNQVAIDFIASHEGCRLLAYQDAGAGIWTVGYGATGPDIVKGVVWTQAQADAALAETVGKVEASVRRALKNAVLSTEQMAACISFAYNVGEGAFASSTLLVRIQDGDFLGAAKQFPLWDKAGGKELKGLLIRRFEEATLFLQGS